MKGIVHFAVGIGGAMLVMLELRPEQSCPRELTAVLASGVWATIPDWWWLLTDRFVPAIYAPQLGYMIRNEFYRSTMANLFWLHRLIDRAETGHPRLEARIALAGGLAIGVFYGLARAQRVPPASAP